MRFQYDPNGNLSALAQPGSPPVWLPSEVHQLGTEARDLLSSYDPPDIGLGLDVTSYDYSADRELELVTRPDGQLIDPAYNAAGQLIGVGVPGGSVSYTYGPPADPLAPGKLVSVTSSLDAETLYFGYAGALRTITLPTGTTIEYLHDGFGRRVGKKVDGNLERGWLYGRGLGPVAELGPDGSTLVARFVYATRAHVPDYLVAGGNTYRLITAQLGSVRLIVNVAAGTVAQQLDYDATGQVRSGTNPRFQASGFAAGLCVPDTCLGGLGRRASGAASGGSSPRIRSRFRRASPFPGGPTGRGRGPPGSCWQREWRSWGGARSFPPRRGSSSPPPGTWTVPHSSRRGAGPPGSPA